MSHLVRVLGADELRAAHTLFAAAIHLGPADDERWAAVAPSYAPGRTLGIDAGGELVGTAMSFPTRTAVPGGAALPTAAVTRVGVRADHTRRGLLTALMEAQLDAAAGAGEVLACLRASEARIYGRFGYGVATRSREIRVRRRGGGWRPGAPLGGSVRLLDRAAAVPALAAVHDAIGLRRPGGMSRPRAWWSVDLERRLADREHVVTAVHTGAGGDDGFAVAAPDPAAGDEAGLVLTVHDLHAADAAATAGLWRFLLGIDLVRTVRGRERPLDEPLELMLADPRDCATVGHGDETWLRIVDVPAALAARGWGAAGPVRLGVHDRLLPANTGVHRLADGTAERLPAGAATDLECDVAGLAMAYLGDRAPSELAAAGWWTVRDPAALARADALFAVPGSPWCGTGF